MERLNKSVYVTQPDLPPIEELTDYLKEIWDTKILTNNGPFHQEFEKKLADYLGVEYISIFANGTLALITAIHALGIKGEVITTPYSFVATSHSLFFNKITTVFSDIEPVYFNLNPAKVEAAITKNTTAILPVHVYGNPCDVEALQDIADRNGLKLIYDAAHAFGVEINGKSILKYGDLSILSFHATKVFNTLEGGAIICKDAKMKQKVDNLKNFGITSETTISEPGINAKMNEIQAVYGILQLKYIDQYISKRKKIADQYKSLLNNLPGVYLLPENSSVKYSYNYFPILINKQEYGLSRDELYEILKTRNVFTRRYFYPLISHVNPYSIIPSADSSNLPVAEKIAGEVLCLPLYGDLSTEEMIFIIRCITTNQVKLKSN